MCINNILHARFQVGRSWLTLPVDQTYEGKLLESALEVIEIGGWVGGLNRILFVEVQLNAMLDLDFLLEQLLIAEQPLPLYPFGSLSSENNEGQSANCETQSREYQLDHEIYVFIGPVFPL